MENLDLVRTPAFRRVENEEDLRSILALPEALDTLLSLDAASVPFVVQLLQSEVHQASSTDLYRRQCWSGIRALAKKHRVLPDCLFLNNITREGNHPLYGGGFADVFKGSIEDRPVCLKVLRTYVKADQRKRDKMFVDFCQEALLCIQLNHPNVLPLLGINFDLFVPGLCLVSPWMVNGNIISYLEHNPDHDKLKCIFEIASGLAYLHNLDPMVTHNDIKGWMTAGKDKSPRDIYAYACTVLEIITGKPPFFGLPEPTVMLYAIHGKRPERPTVGWCPDDIWGLVERCWVEDPAKRPRALDIERYLRLCVLAPPRDTGSSALDAPLREVLSLNLDARASVIPQQIASTNVPALLPPAVDIQPGAGQTVSTTIKEKNIGKWFRHSNIPRLRLPPQANTRAMKSRKRALLIGIRAFGLEACSDVDDWKKLLVGFYGYREEDVIVMKDKEEEVGSRFYPNHANIMRVLTNEFILKDEENVLYFFLYSGCSGPTECYDMDGLEDVIVPVDALDQYGNIIPERTILDYVLRQALVVSLPSRCKLVYSIHVIVAHSWTSIITDATGLSHPGMQKVVGLNESVSSQILKTLVWQGLQALNVERPVGETWSRIAKRICSVLVPKAINAEKHCADVICISSCRDREHAGAWDETSLDSGGVSVAKASFKL
uniref:Protein kinase domain-containing protein n=1 Tax=Moniliophthora roreri TaxID=221103 RepID=A0A0W0ETT3_MONRR